MVARGRLRRRGNSVKEFVVHVGLHKTGSTLIQRMLGKVSEELAEQGVLLRPRVDLYKVAGFSKVVRTFHRGAKVGPARLKDVSERTRAFLLEHDFERVLTSDETLLGWRLDFDYPGGAYMSGLPALRWLHDLVVEHMSVRVVMYVRRQDRFLESVYLQQVHEGSLQTFAEWFSSKDARRFDWLDLAVGAEAIVGKDQLVVRPFEMISAGPVSFCEDFIRIIDPTLDVQLPTEEITKIAGQANRSLSGRGLEIAQHVYPVLTAEEKLIFRRKFIQRYFSNQQYERAKLFSPEQAAHVRQLHVEGNTELFHRFMPDLDPTELGYLESGSDS